MNHNTLISQSRTYYRRFYRLVALAVVIMMAVLTGSMMIGDSVRGTLTDRVNERLGTAETVIATGTSFLNEQIMLAPALADAHGYLLVQGFISADGKLIPVYVWGTDGDSIAYGEALINEPLARKLSTDSQLSLHLPSHNLVPSGSLFVTKSYATQMRISIKGTKSVEQGGNLLLKNEQTLPLNVFVNRRQLGEVMELEGKLNIILADNIISEEQVTRLWNPALSGLHLTDSTVTYDGIFIQDEVVRELKSQAIESKGRLTTYLSYLVNEIIHAADTVPYSFVTAVDRWKGEVLTGNDIILSDYAAERLHVGKGDSVRMSYFLSKDLKNLETREQLFHVKAIEPLSAFMDDELLTAEFPGLSNVEKCTDWDSDLPIDMNHIHKADEDFWYSYRQTPKAIVAYDAVVNDWSGSFGTATALRLSGKVEIKAPKGFLTVIHPRQQGLYSATNGTDFTSLFMALGFFIILSAILLMQNPLVEMFTKRKEEIQLYQQLGYKPKTIQTLLFKEAFSAMLLASPMGVLAGILYSATTLWLLGNVWSGATHTEGFALHISVLTIVLSWTIGVTVCATSLWLVVRKLLTPSNSGHTITKTQNTRLWLCGYVAQAITIALIGYNFIHLHSMALFIVSGLLWIITFGIFFRAFVNDKMLGASAKIWSRARLVWQSIYASRRQHSLAYWSLSIGVFTVFAVGLNRPDFSDADMFATATGGYDVYIDSRVPIQYDLNNEAVRRKLSLTELPEGTQFLQFMRHTQDEASCLNLNKVTTPTVLGVELNYMKAFGVNGYDINRNPDEAPLPSVYIDQESLIWSMMKSVGDTIIYKNSRGEDTQVLIAGTYPTGIFHGNAIMSASDFRSLWPRENGIEVLLLKSPKPEQAAELLSIAMSEYGLTIQTTAERIRMFFEVTDTYLIIFLTLGGLGLLLGIFSLIIIVRKNLAASQATISQYSAMGFSTPLIRTILYRENIIIPLFAVLIGAVGSVISISANVGGAGASAILLATGALVILCITLTYGIRRIISQQV